jgi:hypothetical protein
VPVLVRGVALAARLGPHLTGRIKDTLGGVEAVAGGVVRLLGRFLAARESASASRRRSASCRIVSRCRRPPDTHET